MMKIKGGCRMDRKDDDMIREPQTAYQTKRQGEYTLDDYYALPEERRVELIDGVIYEMTSPSVPHQLVGLEIWRQIETYVRRKKGSCIPLAAPVDVQLDCDEKTMVQPDVLIVCDRDKIIKRCIYGAPDFVVEVLSPSTKKKDMMIKLNKYMDAGVREYWMVDTDGKRVIVYDFTKENYPEIYGFDARIPLGIFDGDCEIDFTEIYDYIKFLYEE